MFKVPLPRKFRYPFYCVIEIFKRLQVFRCIDEQYPSTRSVRIFRLKLAKCFGAMFWVCDVISMIRLQTTTRKHASESRQIIRLFSTFLVIVFYVIAMLTYLKALGIESDYHTQ